MPGVTSSIAPCSAFQVPLNGGHPWPSSVNAPSAANRAVNAPNASGVEGIPGGACGDNSRHAAITTAVRMMTADCILRRVRRRALRRQQAHFVAIQANRGGGDVFLEMRDARG